MTHMGSTTPHSGDQPGAQGRLRAALAERFGLTERQAEIVGLVCEGFSEKEIAKALHITRDTVHYHMKRAYSALGVHDRSELLIMVFKSIDQSALPD